VQFSFLPLRSALDTSCSVFLSSPARLVFDLVFSGVAFSSVLVADFPSVHSGLAGSLFSVEHFADRFQLPSPASFTSPSLIFLAARQSALVCLLLGAVANSRSRPQSSETVLANFSFLAATKGQRTRTRFLLATEFFPSRCRLRTVRSSGFPLVSSYAQFGCFASAQLLRLKPCKILSRSSPAQVLNFDFVLLD
jgi:hypothetical protein